MIIINYKGGLGNQMFQYAIGEVMKKKGNIVKADLNDFNYNIHHNGFELNEVFTNIDIKIANKNEIYKLKRKNNEICKIIKKIIGDKKTYIKSDKIKYEPEILNLQEAYLDGYWQSSKYFSDIKDVLINNFKFKQFEDLKNIQIEKMINKTNSVSIHVRRGDYKKNIDAKKIFGNICTENYYNNCLNWIDKNINNPKFYIFSDDIEWCKEFFKDKECIYVDWNPQKSSYKDMQLMSICKVNIIANSSFSWWAAYLNKNYDKKVLAPMHWVNNQTDYGVDIICDEWIKIEI